jgi:hypothetical protein
MILDLLYLHHDFLETLQPQNSQPYKTKGMIRVSKKSFLLLQSQISTNLQLFSSL